MTEHNERRGWGIWRWFARAWPGAGGRVVALYVTAGAGQPMQAVDAVTAQRRAGLAGDRYALGTGHWSVTDECEVTLIDEADARRAARAAGKALPAGWHRRNIVTRGVRLERLRGRRFRVGGAVLAFDRPRPPCGYLASLTVPRIVRALHRRGGICARVEQGGPIRVGDALRPMPPG